MIRLGVISLEHPHATQNHFPALKYIQDRVKVAAIAHPNKGEAQSWLDVFGAEYYSDRDSMLKGSEIDAVLVTSRNYLHADDSIAAARAGKDVFCDKPIATSVEDACAIVDAVRAAGVRFITTFPVRFNKSIRQVKAAVEAGELGEIRAIMATNHGCMYEPGEPSWVRDPKQNGGGSLIDHTVHVADIMRWLTRAEFARVRAETSIGLRQTKAEDVAVLHGEMTNGAIFQIDASWSRRGHDPMWGDCAFRIVGTKGSATLDLYNNQRIEVYSPGGIALSIRTTSAGSTGRSSLTTPMPGSGDSTSPSYAQTKLDGLRTIELVFAGYESAKNGQTVEIRLNK